MRLLIFIAVILSSASVANAGLFRWRRAATCETCSPAVQKSAVVQKTVATQKSSPVVQKSLVRERRVVRRRLFFRHP